MENFIHTDRRSHFQFKSDITPSDLAATFTNAFNTAQAEFLNHVGERFEVFPDKQIEGIVDNLDDFGKKFIIKLMKTIEGK